MILINEQQIRARIPASANIEMSLLRPNIILYQETRLEEILGSSFYNDIVLKYTNQTLSVAEQTLLINYIHPVISYGGLNISIPFLYAQISNRGIVQQTGDFTNTAGDSAFRQLRDSVKSSTDSYEQKLIKYLKLNASSFPLYTYNSGDVVNPENQSPNDFGMVLDFFGGTCDNIELGGCGCGSSPVFYYGSFYDTTTQINPSATASNLMTFNSTDISNGVSILNGSEIHISNAGIYNIQFSAQFDKTDSGIDEVEVWLRKNGVNLSHSTTVLTLNGNNDKVVGAWNFFVTSNAGDYFELVWHSLDLNLRILSRLAQTNPDRPEVPSIILTVNKID